jgi:hypothetical protein
LEYDLRDLEHMRERGTRSIEFENDLRIIKQWLTGFGKIS